MSQQWEYKEELIEPSKLLERKNQLGKEGWQAYDQHRINENSDSSYKVFFKRVKNAGPQLLKS